MFHAGEERSHSILRPRKCVMKRWLNFHTPWGMFPTILRHKRCATSLYTITQQYFFFVPDCFKTQKLCIRALEVDPWALNDIPDYLKTQKMCNETVRNDPSSLQLVPDCFFVNNKWMFGMTTNIGTAMIRLMSCLKAIKITRHREQK